MTSFSRNLPGFLALLLALVSGLVSVADYFFGLAIFTQMAQMALKVTVLVSGAALLMAAFHLLLRHGALARQKQAGSWLLVLGFVVAFVAGLAPSGFRAGWGGWLYQWLLAPGMAALFALLPIFLIYALFRHLSVRDVGGFLFLAGLVLVLLGQIPALAAYFPVLAAIRHDILIGPVAAAFRGIIFGLTIGAILAIFLKIIPRAGMMRRREPKEDQA